MALDYKAELEKFEADLKTISAMFGEMRPKGVRKVEEMDWAINEAMLKKFEAVRNTPDYLAYRQWMSRILSDERYHPVARYYLIVGDSEMFYFRERLKDAIYYQSVVARLSFIQRLFSTDARELKSVENKIAVVKSRAIAELARFCQSETPVIDENQYVQELKRIKDEENLLRVQRNEFRTQGAKEVQDLDTISITREKLKERSAKEAEDERRYAAWCVKIFADPKYHVISKLILIQSDNILANTYKGLLERCVQAARSHSAKLADLNKELLETRDAAQKYVNQEVESWAKRIQ